MTCLRSLLRHPIEHSYEVIVALNTPAAELLRELEDTASGIELLAYPVNLGFGAACNRGATIARGEYLLFLNDDTEVTEGWLSELVGFADSDPRVGAVGSANLDPNGDLQQAGAILWREGWPTTITKRSLQLLGDSELGTRPRRVDFCGASSLLVRRTTWADVGGFEEIYYPAYFEDVDLCLKIASRGQWVACQPASRVVHRTGASSSLAFRTFISQRNHERFCRRWQTQLNEREPFGPEDPAALKRAIERAARLDSSRADGLADDPLLIDLKLDCSHTLTHDEELGYLRLELETMAGFAAEMTEKLDSCERDGSVLSDRIRDLESASDLLASERDAAQAQSDEHARSVAAFKSRLSVRLAEQVAPTLKRIPGVRRG